MRIHANTCEDVSEFCRRLSLAARDNGCKVVGVFNDRELVACPTTIALDLYEQWDLVGRREYFGESAKFRTMSN